jgi:Ribonuclease G/E
MAEVLEPLRRRTEMEDKLAELRRRLDEKTTEIEAFIAREQGMGDIRAMSPSDYEQLQRDVEELLEQWEEAAPEEGYGTPEDSQLDKLISERFEIEQKILVVSGEQTEGDDLDGSELEDKETFPES